MTDKRTRRGLPEKLTVSNVGATLVDGTRGPALMDGKVVVANVRSNGKARGVHIAREIAERYNEYAAVLAALRGIMDRVHPIDHLNPQHDPEYMAARKAAKGRE